GLLCFRGDGRTHRRQRRARSRRQAGGYLSGGDDPARRRTRPHRRRSRGGEDAFGEGPGALGRGRLPAHPVHPGPAARRRHRHERLQPGRRGLRVLGGAGLRQRGAGRRDQSGKPQDAERAAGGDGGGFRDGRRRDQEAARDLWRDRHPEPRGARGDVPAAARRARPLYGQDVFRLPGRGGRGGPLEALGGPGCGDRASGRPRRVFAYASPSRGGIRERSGAALRRLGDGCYARARGDSPRGVPAREPDAPRGLEDPRGGPGALLLYPGRREGPRPARSLAQDHRLPGRLLRGPPQRLRWSRQGRGRGARDPLVGTRERGGL
ncbi:MAG: FIG022979: MoxR-like ATPases, partial [uncultured Rubrobacteraceae bacterium]